MNISVASSLSSEDLREPTEMTESEEDNNDDDDDEEGSDDTVIRRLMEEGDTITFAFRCARVEGLDAYEGLMLLGREHFYLIDGFTLLSTREIRDIESIPAAQREPGKASFDHMPVKCPQMLLLTLFSPGSAAVGHCGQAETAEVSL